MSIKTFREALGAAMIEEMERVDLKWVRRATTLSLTRHLLLEPRPWSKVR